MKELKIQSNDIFIMVEDEKVCIKEPSVVDLENFIEEITKGVGEIAAMKNLLSVIADKKEVVGKMTMSQIKAVIKHFSEGK